MFSYNCLAVFEIPGDTSLRKPHPGPVAARDGADDSGPATSREKSCLSERDKWGQS